MNLPVEEKILLSLFFCSNEPNEILAALKPERNEQVQISLNEKRSITGFELQSVFPWKDELSQGIDYEKFCKSFFVQPDLFLRLRPGKENIVKEKLQRSGIEFNFISGSCIALDNATKIDTVIELDKEAVVQDYSSQQIGSFLKRVPGNQQPASVSLWDCCAGSGGKSIMAYDLNNDLEMTVSDNRASILANLQQRFKKAGIKKYNSFVTDLTKPHLPLAIQQSQFDVIICDTPCTGSGTWSRTPEQLFFFEKDKIEQFASLQKKIVSNVILQVKQGGYFLYVTCSVFKKENEEVVKYIENNFGLKKIKQELLRGYDKKADTLFTALFQK